MEHNRREEQLGDFQRAWDSYPLHAINTPLNTWLAQWGLQNHSTHYHIGPAPYHTGPGHTDSNHRCPTDAPPQATPAPSC